MGWFDIPEQEFKQFMDKEAAERRARAIAFTNGFPVADVEEQLLMNGRDAEYNKQAEANSVRSTKDARRAAALDIATDPDIEIEEKEFAVQSLAEPILPNVYADVEDTAKAIPAQDFPSQTSQNESVARGEFLKGLQSYYDKSETKKNYLAQEAQSLLVQNMKDAPDLNLATAAAGGAASMAPLVLYNMWNSVFQEMHPDVDTNLFEKISVGGLLDYIKKHRESIKDEKERREYTTKLFKSIDNNSFYSLGINPLEAFFAKQEAIEPSDEDFSEFINSASSWAEVIGYSLGIGSRLVPLARGVTKIGRILKRGDPLDSLRRYNPEAYASAIKSANMMSDAEFKKVFGVSKDDIVVDNFQSDKFIPGDVIEQHLQSSKIADEAQELIENDTLMFTNADTDAAEKGLKKILSMNYPSIHHGMTQIDRTKTIEETGAFKYKAYIGETTTNGFKTIQDAKDVVDANFSKEFAGKITYHARDADGDLLDLSPNEIKALGDTEGSFFYSIEGELPITTLLKQSARSLDETEITKPWVSGMQPFLEGVYDNATMFSQRISRHLDSLQLQSAAVAGKMQDIARPFLTASNKDKNTVLKRVGELIEQGDEFSFKWMLTQGFTKNQLHAAIALKETTDAMHKLMGRNQYLKLFSEGQKRIVIGAKSDGSRAKFETIGKVLSLDDVIKETSRSKIHYYNTSTGNINDLNQAEVVQLYEAGFKVVRSKNYLGKQVDEFGNKITSRHILIDDLDEVTEIPMNPLNYNPRYVAPQIYDAPIFIRQKKNVWKEGKLTTYWQAVATADNWKQAALDVKKLERESGGQFKATYSKELGPDMAKSFDDAAEEIASAQGFLFTSRRGDKITNVDKIPSLKNPITALTEGINRMSNTLTRRPAIDQLKKDLMYNFNDVLRDRKSYPRSLEDIDPSTSRGKQARVLWQKIDDLENVNNFRSLEGFRQMLLERAMAIGNREGSGLLADYTSRALMAAGKHFDPRHIGTALAHRLFIAMFPTRQLVIQGQQWIMLTPVIGRRMPNAIGNYMKIVDGLFSRRLGLSVDKETAKLLKAIDESGFLKTVDQHAHLDGLNAGTKVWKESTSMERLGKILDAPFNVGKNGFVAGESINRIMTFTASMERFFLKSKRYPRNRREWQEVSSEAMQLTGAITKDSAYIWQKGLLGALTQFMSVQMKLFHLMVPNTKYSKGSKVLSNADKAKLAAGQLVLHGPQGFGLANVADSMFTTLGYSFEPEYRTAILGGVVDAMAYQLMDEQYLLSEAMSGAGGALPNLFDLIGAGLGLNGADWYDKIPAVAAGSKVVNAIKDVYFLSYALDTKDPVVKAKTIADAILQTTGQWSSYTVANAAAVYDEIYTKSGRPLGLPVADSYPAVKALVGLKTRGENDYYKMLKDKGISEYSDPQAEYDKDVKAIVGQFKRFIGIYNQKPNDNFVPELQRKQEFNENIETLNRAITGIHGAERATAMLASARMLLMKEDPTTYGDLMEVILGDVVRGFSPDQNQRNITIIQNLLPSMPEGPQKESFKMALEQILKENDL